MQHPLQRTAAGQQLKLSLFYIFQQSFAYMQHPMQCANHQEITDCTSWQSGREPIQAAANTAVTALLQQRTCRCDRCIAGFVQQGICSCKHALVLAFAVPCLGVLAAYTSVCWRVVKACSRSALPVVAWHCRTCERNSHQLNFRGFCYRVNSSLVRLILQLTPRSADALGSVSVKCHA